MANDKSQFDRYADLTVDFGFYRADLSGTVWNDGGAGATANNGILDFGENGLANYRVKIFQANGAETAVGADGMLGTSDDAPGGVLTDGNGNYSFRGLAEGNYTVKVERQNANSSLPTSFNPNDNVDFDDNGNADGSGFIVSSPVSLALANRGMLENIIINEFSGITENPTLDFGLIFAPTAAAASVAGVVVDSHGRYISRAGLELLDTATNEVKIRTTNQFGHFAFDAVPVGRFYVLTVRHKQHSFFRELFN